MDPQTDGSRIMPVVALALTLVLAWTLASDGPADAGPYLLSAHGDPGSGVLRTSLETVYFRGNCAHCHEQHASIGGIEPNPQGGPDQSLLFDENPPGQTDNFCFRCHAAGGMGWQSGGTPPNYSYSHSFGGNSAPGSYDSSVQEAFGHIGSGSSHHLPSLTSQAFGRNMRNAQGVEWRLPQTLNPCGACHNPHLAQDNMPVSFTGGLLNTAVSSPSDRDGLLGDTPDERASAGGGYQAPYWYGRTDSFEPANDSVQDGSNLPDFNRLCTDCHNQYSTIYSDNPRLPNGPRALKQINWGVAQGADKHGRNAASPRSLQPPYSNSRNYTLGCLDCHEPHGSTTNIYLLRTSVNGGPVDVTGESGAAWKTLCGRCHVIPIVTQHTSREDCQTCHVHGATF